VNAGVPAHEAMAVSGHRTRSVFDRYSLSLKEQTKKALRTVTAYTQQSTPCRPSRPPWRAARSGSIPRRLRMRCAAGSHSTGAAYGRRSEPTTGGTGTQHARLVAQSGALGEDAAA
jgi:ribosomal protein S19E (S16A)